MSALCVYHLPYFFILFRIYEVKASFHQIMVWYLLFSNGAISCYLHRDLSLFLSLLHFVLYSSTVCLVVGP